MGAILRIRRAVGAAGRLVGAVAGRLGPRRAFRRRAASTGFVLVIFAAFLGMIWPTGCTPRTLSEGVTPEGRIIRVRLLASVDQVQATASEPPVYLTTGDGTLRYLDLPHNVPMAITLTPAGWRVGSATLGSGELVLRPATIGSLAMNGATYRGQYRLVATEPGRFDVVNDVDIEDYLYGVVPRELFSTWHEEAYRAQTVAARTYALFEKHTPRTPRHWDVYPDERSQVYGGIPAETAKSREAVDATRGIVLAYGPSGNERIFKAYFSSCCGGVTAGVDDTFRESPFPPMSARYVGPVCSGSPRFNWGPVVVTKEELTRRFRAYGRRRNSAEQNMGMVQSIQIAAQKFGRPTQYLATDAGGLRYALSAEQLRWAVNTESTPATMLYSGFVENIINEPDRIRFVGGHGHGHGVGMCQWCTEARARAGMGHEDILLYAYPGAKLLRAY